MLFPMGWEEREREVSVARLMSKPVFRGGWGQGKGVRTLVMAISR